MFRADGTTVRYRLGHHYWNSGEGAEMAAFSWTTATDDNGRSGLMLALSPDGTTLRAVDTGKDPLGGVRNWIATRAGAPAPAPAPVDQAGPSAEQRERLAAWTGPWAVSTDDEVGRTVFIDFAWKGGALIGQPIDHKANGQSEPSRSELFVVDLARSTGDVLYADLHIGADKAASVEIINHRAASYAKLVLTTQSNGSIVYLRRAAEIGRAPVTPSPAAIRQAMIGVSTSKPAPRRVSAMCSTMRRRVR